MRQPPISSTLLHSCKPLAERIQQNNADDPGDVDKAEIETNSLRRSVKRFYRRLKQPAHWFAESKVQENRDDVRSEPLQHVKEQRHAPKRNKKSGDCVSRRCRLKQRERYDRRTKRHQKKEQGRRILRRIQKRQHGVSGSFLLRPFRRVAVSVNHAQDDKEHSRCTANDQEPAPSTLWLKLIKHSKDISRSHHSNPRNQRVNHKYNRTRKAQNRKSVECVVQQNPELGAESGNRSPWSTPSLHTKRVKQVMTRNH